jgi:hypothetical protein
MRIVIILVFLLSQMKSIGQQSTDGEFIFKTQLFLEKANVVNVRGFDTKGKDLLLFFSQKVKFKLDTLQSYGFAGTYYFLSLSIKEGIKYNDTIIKSDSSFFLFIENGCANYILAVNKYNGKSYRLKGFNGNDFYNLFADINKQFEKLNLKKINIKKFLKEYRVNSVDFNCLYAALKSGEYNKERYPCLKSCEVQQIVVH